MRRVLFALGLVLLLMGCDKDPIIEIEYFPPLELSGGWTVFFADSVQGRLIVAQDNLNIRAQFQPNRHQEEWVEMFGTQYPNTRQVTMEGGWWTMGVTLRCFMVAFPPYKMEGQMDVVDPIGNSLIYTVRFYALRDGTK